MGQQVNGVLRLLIFVAAFVGFSSLAVADVVEQGAKDSPPSGLLAGVARADITPAVGTPHMNWGSATHIEADGVDPTGMYVTALVLSDGKQKFAMVDIDALGVAGMDAEIERASARTGIPAAHIRLGASHTHAGAALSSGTGPAGADLTPYRPMMETYRAMVADKVVGAIIEANSRLQPVHMHGGRGTGTINVNRRFRGANGGPPAVGRNPDEFVDRELVVFRIDDAQGKPYAVLANFQCHGTVLAYENTKLSPDWIGMTRRVIEETLPGATALFFQGAAGNQGPTEGFTGDLAVAHRLGAILGLQAAAVALQVETVKREPKFEGYVESRAYQAKQHWRVSGPRDATLKVATKVIQVPQREYAPDEIDNMAAQVADAQKSVHSLREGDQSREAYQARARLRRLSGLLDRWKEPPSREPVTVQLQILRIGDLAIVAMPGEPFAEIGAAIKKASPFAFTMFCGYSSGVGGGYMAIESEYQYRGYEIEGTRYGRGAAAEVIRAAIEMYQDVR